MTTDNQIARAFETLRNMPSIMDIIKNPGKYGPPHRSGMSHCEWEEIQPKPEDSLFLPGDIIKCKKSGDLCVITKRLVGDENSGNIGAPARYEIMPIAGHGEPGHRAWYYDLDLEMVEPSPARKYMKQ